MLEQMVIPRTTVADRRLWETLEWCWERVKQLTAAEYTERLAQLDVLAALDFEDVLKVKRGVYVKALSH